MGSLRNPRKIDQDNGLNRRRSYKRILALVLVTILLSCIASFAAVEVWPSFGARVADGMRKIVGPQPVAQLESVVFQVQDTVKRWQYRWGGEEAEAPWENNVNPLKLTSTAQDLFEETIVPSELTIPTPNVTKTPDFVDPVKDLQEQPTVSVASPTPTPTPTLSVWQLSPLLPFGSMEGEGIWIPYLHDQDGEVVAVRTFLQPDPERPYTIVAVVAIDLTRTQLHFVLGFDEPSLPDGPTGDGLIPDEDREAGVLLAAFNGGFRAANGHFGAMANNIEALPPIDEMATIGIYRDGAVWIGNWGEDITDTLDLLAWRQNCRLIIQNGEISPRVYNDSIVDWGASISNNIVTRRSAIGLDQEAQTLYYFAGPGLSMPVLADVMLATGVHQGMLLDINNFWVHFSAIHSIEGELIAEPLLPKDMYDQTDRFLGPFAADFFYVTLLEDH